MSVVWSDAFTVAANERLNARTGWTRIGGNGSSTNNNQVMLVEAATDDVRMPNGGFYEICRATNAALPTVDQQLNLSVTTGSNSLSHAGGILRAPTAGGENGYQLRIRPSDGYSIVRAVSGAYTDLASGGSIAVSTTAQVQCRATGTATVAISIRDSGGTPIVSFNDSSASRHQSGTPGIGGYNEGGTNPRINDVEVDDLVTGGTPRQIAAETSQPQTASAAVEVERPVTAESSQPQTGTGALQVTRPLAGASSQPQTAAASLEVQKPVAATSSQPQTSSAALRVERPVAAGSVQPQQGAAALQVGKVIAATGSMPQLGEVALLVVRPLAAESSQPQTGSGRVHIGEIIVAEGYLSGTIARGAALTGTIARGDALTGTVTRRHALSATITRRP